MSIRTIDIGGGRRIAVGESGDADGHPILVNHGMVASIRDDSLFDSLVGNGYRVISVARPGYGLSTPFEMRNVGEWGRIVGEVLESEGLSSIDVLGISSGAPYSYAIASAIPEKVGSVYIFSGTPALYDADVQAIWPYPLNADSPLSQLQALARELFFPDGTDQNDAASVDSAMNGCFGIALDLGIRCRDWGFELGQIGNEVRMEHAIGDTSVPFRAAEITSGLLGNCALVARTTGDHFSRESLDGFLKNTVMNNN